MRVPVITNYIVKTANGSAAWVLDKPQTNAHVAFFYIECVCNAWFTFEIMVSEIKFFSMFKKSIYFLLNKIFSGSFHFITK